MKRLQTFMKKHWVIRNVIAVFLGIFGWYLGAYIGDVHLPEGSPLILPLPFIMVAILVVPFVKLFVGSADNKSK